MARSGYLAAMATPEECFSIDSRVLGAMPSAAEVVPLALEQPAANGGRIA